MCCLFSDTLTHVLLQALQRVHALRAAGVTAAAATVSDDHLEHLAFAPLPQSESDVLYVNFIRKETYNRSILIFFIHKETYKPPKDGEIAL